MVQRTLTPALRPLDWEGAHRLIPSLYSEVGATLAEIVDDDAMLADVLSLDGATNDRLQGEQHGLPGISTFELIYGIPNAQIVNAAFTHTSEVGSRFSDQTRGAWYAAEQLEASLAEVTYHKARRLAEMVVPGLPGSRPDHETSTYDDWLADFRSTFHALEPPEEFSECLQAEPVPQCYAVSQQMARRLLDQGSNGLLYPSVRRAESRCLVCFRPALVYHPRRAERLEIRFETSTAGYEHQVRRISR